jgi:isopentenyl diphosphate isomerase/L-lactate dehydrogenase-like FMN-dependent dehydrogenase
VPAVLLDGGIRRGTDDLVARAVAAGCAAICITVDSPVFGARNREARTRFELPAGRVEGHRSGRERGPDRTALRMGREC